MHDYHLLSTSIFSLHPPTLLLTTSLLFGFMKSCLIVLCLQRFNAIKREPDENSCAAAVLYQGYPGSPVISLFSRLLSGYLMIGPFPKPLVTILPFVTFHMLSSFLPPTLSCPLLSPLSLPLSVQYAVLRGHHYGARI